MRLPLLLITTLLFTLSGCTQFIFQPTQQHVITPDKVNLNYQDVNFNSLDGQPLHGWWLPAKQQASATVLYLHGNAQNISNHLGNAYWLPRAGINLLIIDYRGYGHSSGLPSLPGAILDIEAALQQALQLADDTPLIIIGHSLGASLAIHTLAHSPNKSKLTGAIFVAPFSDYRKVARDFMNTIWFLWPLQYPLSWSINNDFAPIKSVAKLAPLPQLYLYGREDTIIPPSHSHTLFANAGEPKQQQALTGTHNTLFNPKENRQLILDTIEQWRHGRPSQGTTTLSTP